MNFIQFSFSNAYIYSPSTWLHKVQSTYKIMIIFTLLSFIPYFNLSKLVIIVLSGLVILPTLTFHENHYYSVYSILITTILCMLPYSFNYTNHKIYRQVQINFPYRIHFFFKKYKIFEKLISINDKKLILVQAPYFIIKLAIIAILHCIILKTLLLTTMYEDILLSICTYIKIDNYHIKKIIFISSCASQFLEQIMKHIQIIYISIKLRNIQLIVLTDKLSFSYYIIAKFLIYLKNDVYKLSSILYSREFNNEHFKINNISTYI